MEKQDTGSNMPDGQTIDAQETLEQRLETNKRRKLAILEDIGKKAEALMRLKSEIEALKRNSGL